ncbi:TatD family hydrolase [Thermosulfuriphilus sp.]
MVEFVDTHAHLNLPEFKDDLPETIKRAKEAGVTKIINVGIDLKTSQRAIELANQYPGLWATAGFHPHEAHRLSQEDLESLSDLLMSEKVVALGEIGLDYAKERSPKNIQQQALGQQLDLAQRLGLPVVIHDREAHEDLLGIIREIGWWRGVFHCFAGNRKIARSVLDLGFYISITGIVTFPKADNIRDIVAYCPLDRLLIETDCPFLAPVPHRGRRNEPAYVVQVAEEIARVKKISLEEVSRWTTQNTQDLFGI